MGTLDPNAADDDSDDTSVALEGSHAVEIVEDDDYIHLMFEVLDKEKYLIRLVARVPWLYGLRPKASNPKKSG